jgi:hypothetical protein
MVNINKNNAAGALLWIFAGDIIRNTESHMAVSVRCEPPDIFHIAS